MSEGKIYRFYNEYQIEKKKLKIRSFNVLNLCLLQCLEGPDAFKPRLCEKLCQEEYQEYLDYKESIKISDTKKYIFQAETPTQNDPQIKGAYEEYLSRTSQAEARFKAYIKTLGGFLDRMEERYSKPITK